MVDTIQPPPRIWNVILASALESSFGFLEEDTSFADVSREDFYAQFYFAPATDWKMGVRVRVGVTNADADFMWLQTRLYLEKTGLILTDKVGSKWTFRLEPHTTDVKRTRIRNRYDITFPAKRGGMRLRVEPTIDLYSTAFKIKADGTPVLDSLGNKAFFTAFTNRIELTPFMALGAFYWEWSIIHFQTVNYNTDFSAGMGIGTYFSFDCSDKIALGFWLEFTKPYTALNTLTFGDIEFEIELTFII